QNPTIGNAQLNMAGTYTLKITTAQGCTAQTTVTMSVLNPTTSAANTGPYCTGQTINLSCPAATSYTWNGPAAYSSNSQSATVLNCTTLNAGVYTINVSIGTCTAQATTTVNVFAPPSPTATNTGPYCVGQNIQLQANPFNSYLWSGPNSFTSMAQNPSIPSASLTSAGNYTVLVTDANTCTNIAVTNVVVNPLPVIAVNNPTVCLNDNIILSANGGTAFAWSGPLSFNSAVQNPTIVSATIPMTGNYNVTVTDANGCVNTAVANVSVVALPTISIVGTNTLCSQGLNGSPNTVLINGSGANSYNWTMPPGFIASPNTTSPSFTLNPPLTAVDVPATLSVTGSGVFGCTNTAIYNVTVVANPTVVPAPASGSVCQGVSFTFSVNGANTYNWSPPATLNSATGPVVIASPSITTSYSVMGNTAGCNSAIETVTLLVIPNPTVTIVPGNPELCIGQNLNLTALGAVDYSWTPNIAINTTTGQAVVVNPNVNQTYSVIGTMNTCTHVTAVTVTVNPLPTVIVSPSSSDMCMYGHNGSNNTVSLTASGAATYTWGGFTGMTANTTFGSPILATAQPSAMATGTVVGFDGKCTNVASYTVLIIPNPTIAVTSNSMCFGTNAQLVATGASNYTWNPGTFLNTTTGSVVTATPPGTSMFSVFGGSLGCNSTTETSTVVVEPLPIITIAPVTPTICQGEQIGLTAFGASDYTWTPAQNLSSNTGNFVIASPPATEIYTVVGMLNTCTSTAVRQVSVTPLPNLSAIATKTAICRGENVTINANGSMTYTWFPTGLFENPYINQVTTKPELSVTYSLVGKNGPCTTTLTVPITVLEMPNITLQTDRQKICFGNNTHVVASGAQSFTWAPMGSLQMLNNNVAVASPSISTNYTVTGLNTSGSVSCVFTKEILIDVVPTVTAVTGPSVAICRGQSAKLQAFGSDTYVWTPSDGLNNFLIPQPYASPVVTTIYTVNVSNGGFCGSTSTVMVEVMPTPTVDAGPDMIFNIDEPMYLNARGTGTLTWILGDGILCKVCPNSQIMPEKSGCYEIEAVGKNGCMSKDEVCITITKDHNVYIPNVFTPNFDGLNDVFLVYGTGITEVEMTIFDRWGEKLYFTDDRFKGWDGTYKGQEGKQDVYTYLVTYKTLDGKKHTKTGHVTLLK
ncbi:MAG: gliding motility-associated C-terminal domain-containing protein, partial [Bacteroidia bacterium]